VNNAIRTLHLSIDHALANSYRQNVYEGKTAYVAHISLVKGIPFYGFHVGYRFYLKIYLLNPLNITRLADLLRQGAVMKRSLQPYESHLQYVPQWMCDYNLYGCAYMDCAKVKFRYPIPDYFELSNIAHRWHDRSIPKEAISGETVLPRQSHCTLEIDICVQDIINRRDIKERQLHNDFIERVHPISPGEKLVHSMAGLWQDETRRRKKRLGIKDPGSSPFLPEEMISMSASPRDQDKAGWIHEAEFRELLRDLAAEEKSTGDGKHVSFDSFAKKNPLENTVKTVLDSVEDLYPQRLESLNPGLDVDHAGTDNGALMKGDTTLSFSPDEPSGFMDELDKEEAPFAQDRSVPDLLDTAFWATEELTSDSSSNGTGKGTHMLGKVRGECARDFATNANELHLGCLDGEMTPQPLKRNNEEKSSEYHAAKRQKQVLNDDDQTSKSASTGISGFSSFDIAAALEDVPTDVEHKSLEMKLPLLSQDQQSFPRKSVQNKNSSQTQRISFPVVKDPNDPMTVLRFSQKSVFSKDGSLVSEMVDQPSSTSENDIHKELSPEISSIIGDHTLTDEDFNVGLLASNIHDAFDIPVDRKVLCYRHMCPTPNEITATMSYEGRPTVVYQKAYYSDENDVPERQREYAGREFRLESNTVQYLPEFDSTGKSVASLGDIAAAPLTLENQRKRDGDLRKLSSFRIFEFASVPPSRSEVVEWLEKEVNAQKRQFSEGINERIETKPNVLSQIEGATQKNPHGFKYSQKQLTTSVEYQTQYMSVMSLEVHVNSRETLAPNPKEDEIACVIWGLQSDDYDLDANGVLDGVHVGMLAQRSLGLESILRSLSVDVEMEATELELITRLVDIVRFHDPDIITGYEVHNSSWGYLIERARLKYDYDLCDELSRVKTQAHGRFGKENDRWGFNNTSTIRVTGRHMINIWRAMRSELNLLQYTMENVVFHLLHRRIPHYTFKDLTTWYTSSKPRDVMKVVEYFISRTQMDLEILESSELISRTSEQARLLGVDFFSVFSRGSQFKVESLMFRIAKPENFILISPSRKQVGQQNALECLPLVMEPQSDFYTSPVLVLDFQSLYPSIIIAYNYCYSTFLGRLVDWRGRNKMGFADYERQPRLLELLQDSVNIAPNGIMYVKPDIRRSLIARMLSEILETRVMVKGGMKIDKDDKTLQRLLNHRQLALKMIANVTYGYTSASFSGRMPCSEIADSIVQTGRETLERAIALIHSVERWGAEVVYGDTDSLFIHRRNIKGSDQDEPSTSEAQV
jgi:DNA polymerase zeta